ncbi:hypothetical protein AURDEDRAFT_18802, partial [Auricularia subglabra TFB-10046 SS5]
VLTGFTVESYQWLQDDPNDAVISVLTQIAHTIGPNGSGVNAPPAQLSSSGIPRNVSVRVNAYWFTALSLSLATALVAILGKQWLREYGR